MTRAAAGQDLWNLQTVPLPADIGPLDVVSAIRVGPADELLLLLNQPLRQTVAPAQPAPGTTEWVYDAAVSVRVLDRSGAWMTLATKPYTFTRRIVGTAMVATYALDARDLGVSPSGVVFVGGAGGIYEVDARRGWTTVATPAGQPTDAIGRDGPVAAAGFAGAAQLIPDATGLVFYDGQTCQVRRLEGTQLSTLSGPKLAGPEFAGAGFLGENAAGALLIAHGAAPGPLAPSPRGRYASWFGLVSAQPDQPGFRRTPVRSLAATLGAPQCALSTNYRSSSGCTGIAPADGAVPGYWLGAGAAGPLARTGTQFQTGLDTGAGTVVGSTAGWPGVLGGDAPSGPSGVHVAGNALHFFGWVRTDPPVAPIVYHELRLYRVDLATGLAAVVAGATIDSSVFSGRRVDLSALIPEGGGGPALIQRRSDGAYWLSNGKELWLLDAAGQLRRMAGLSTSGGGVDASGTAASFGLIASIRVLPDNRLLVVDQGAHAVRLASDDGKVITLVGQLNQAGQMPGALPARLDSPVDVWPIGRDLVITTMTSRRLLRASAAF